MMKKLREALKGMSEPEKLQAIFLCPLTGVYNRSAFRLAKYEYVALVDLDSLKYINDTHGHRAGDLEIMSLSAALCRACGTESVFRLAGDEFAVISDDAGRLISSLNDLQAERSRFSYGVGLNLYEADIALRLDKFLRALNGKRAPRGMQPPIRDTKI